MRKTAITLLASAAISVVAVSTTGTTGFSALFVAVAAGFGTGLLFDLIGTVLRHIYRNDRDVEKLLHGLCPQCDQFRTLEVTSDTDTLNSDGFREHSTELHCSCCKGDIRITSSEGGPIVTRLNF